MRYAIGYAAVIVATLGGGALAGCGGDGSSGSGGQGGGSSADAVNGCDAAKAEDKTGETAVTITAAGTTYTPSCIRIKKGTTVTWETAFAAHPLRGGKVVDGDKTPDSSSPIKATDAGDSAAFAFPDTGTFGFYCDFHASVGMSGAIIVE